MIYSDNKKIINGVISPAEKESFFIQEASTIISSIRDEIKKSTIEISIEYSNNKPCIG